MSFTVRKHTDTPCSVLKQEPTICISVLAEALVELRHSEVRFVVFFPPHICTLGNLVLIMIYRYSSN